MALTAFSERRRQPVERLGTFTGARQKRLDRLHIVRVRSTGHTPIGSIGKHDAAARIGDQYAVGMTGQEGPRQFVGARLRHDLDEADQRRHQKEDADHRQNAEQPEHDFVIQRMLENDKAMATPISTRARSTMRMTVPPRLPRSTSGVS